MSNHSLILLHSPENERKVKLRKAKKTYKKLMHSED